MTEGDLMVLGWMAWCGGCDTGVLTGRDETNKTVMMAIFARRRAVRGGVSVEGRTGCWSMPVRQIDRCESRGSSGRMNRGLRNGDTETKIWGTCIHSNYL